MVRSVYVRSSEGVITLGIGLGIYRASLASAKRNPESSRAARPSVSYRLPQSMQFYEVESSGPVQSVSLCDYDPLITRLRKRCDYRNDAKKRKAPARPEAQRACFELLSW
jgi:hypothetical protein